MDLKMPAPSFHYDERDNNFIASLRRNSRVGDVVEFNVQCRFLVLHRHKVEIRPLEFRATFFHVEVEELRND